MATPTDGDKLSLGNLGRATAVGNSNYTSKTSLNDAGRDSGTAKTKISDFYVATVDSTLDGYPYVDEQTNETYEVTFTNSNTLFDSRVKTRAENFTWATNNSSLFNMSGTEDYTTQYNAATITNNTSPSLGAESAIVTESNLVLNHQFRSLFASWSNSGGSGIAAVTSVYDTDPPDASPSASAGGFEEDVDNRAIQFKAVNSYVTQSLTVKGNSTYQIRTVAWSAAPDANNIKLQISGAYHQNEYSNLASTASAWSLFREDFYTSGSPNVDQTLELRFTASAADGSNHVYLDSVYFERWEGANFSDTEVIISGKYHDDGQNDGFNDQATRYNTAISKTVEIQDTYGGLSIACFLPETLILMADGTSKPIEEINIGDDVMSLDLPGLPDEKLGYLEWKSFTMKSMDSEDLKELVNTSKSSAYVENLFYDYINGYYNINNDYLKVTGEHDLFIYNGSQWEWVTASNLKVGMKLFGFDGSLTTIDSVEYIDGEVEVVNIDVEPLDVYYAGGVLVHNKGVDDNPTG